MSPKPLLLLSDAPSAMTGLGRITRDLATRIACHLPDTFRVATLGYGGTGQRALPFQQYAIQSPVTTNGWYVPELQHVWEDFAGSERGAVMTIWDPSRMGWFAQPGTIQSGLSQWLTAPPFERWGYFPVDASGPNGKLTAALGQVIKGFDRGLCYSKWAEGIVRATVGEKDAARLGLTSLPHGIDTAKFKPRPRAEAKQKFRELGWVGLSDSSFLVGIVATNQARKDYGLGIEVCSRLLQQGLDVRLWIHTDTTRRHWDLVALLTDFDLLGRVVITTENYRDEEMAWMYSACDVTLSIGLGEGFGFCTFESLACGTHVVSGDYGGAPEHLIQWVLEEADAWRYEGQWNCVRPLFSPAGWAVSAEMASKRQNPAALPPNLDWSVLWPNWENWLRQVRP